MTKVVGERCKICRKTAPMSGENYEKRNLICLGCEKKNKPPLKLRSRFTFMIDVRVRYENKIWPISKIKRTTWTFVKETKECSFEEALKEAAELQKKDKSHRYRIWDCR